MITLTETPEYRKCDLPSCKAVARREFTKTDQNGCSYRVFVCADHEVEGFIRVKELG